MFQRTGQFKMASSNPLYLASVILSTGFVNLPKSAMVILVYFHLSFLSWPVDACNFSACE
jgi:hypothetical protein